MTKTRRRNLLFSLLAIILLPVVMVVTALNNASFQSFLAHRLASYFSKQLHTTITIDDLDFGIFSHIRLHHLLICDQQHDTLLYVDAVRVGILDLDFSSRVFQFNHLILDKPYFNLKEDSSTTNLQFLLDYFSSSDTTTIDTTSPPKILTHDITIQDGRFCYHLKSANSTQSAKSPQIDWDNLAISNIFISLKNLKNTGDRLSTQIKAIRLQEQSKFRILKMVGNFVMDSSQLNLENFKIATIYSALLGNQLQFSFSSWSDFSDFLNKIHIHGDFNWSALNFKDLAKFAPPFSSMHQRILFQGIANGTVSNLRTKDFLFNWGDASQAAFSGSIAGLPDLEETFINVRVKTLTSNKQDLEKLLTDSAKLPEILGNLNAFNFSGELTGFYTDLVAYGTFNTNLGILKTDLSLKQDSSGNRFYYEGECASQSFDIGRLLGQSPLLGNITVKASVKGEYWKNHNMITLDGIVDSLWFKQHYYKNITINGVLKNRMFDGELKINDPLLQFDFLGLVDFSEKQMKFDFTADIKHAQLQQLHLLSDSTLLATDFLLKSNIVSTPKEGYKGSLELYQTKLYFSDTTYNIAQFYATLKRKKEISSLDIQSDFLTAQAQWNIITKKMNDYILTRLKPFYSYLPTPAETSLPDSTYINLHLTTTDNTLLNHFLPKTTILGDSIQIAFTDTPQNNILNINIIGNSISIADNILKNPRLSATQVSNTEIQIDITADTLENNLLLLNRWNSRLLCFHDTVELSSSWNETDSTMGSNLQAVVHFQPQKPLLPQIVINAVPSYFTIGKKIWYLNDAEITIDTQKTILKQFIVNHDDEYIYANGNLSQRKEDTIHFVVNDINVGDFDDLIPSYKISGLANGAIDFSMDSNTFLFDSHIDIDRFSVNNELLGNLTLKSQWLPQDKSLFVNFYSKRGKLTPVKAVGNYNVTTKALDFNITLSKVVLKKYEFLTDGILSHLRGLLNGEITLGGTLNKPLLNGVVRFEKTAFTVDYLQTSYNFAGPVTITPTDIEVKNLILNDNISGKQAVLKGTLTHNYLQDVKFDFNLKTKDFLFLHTRERDNDLFFGDVYAGGVVSISGTPRLMALNATVKTNSNTKFNLQLNSAEEASSYNFVNFVSHQPKNSIIKKKTVVVSRDETTNITFLFDVSVTPDAEIQLIFDSKVGDIIKANGHGDLELSYNQNGVFSMFGDYSIDQGDYLFTLQDIVNKKFDIEKGSTIKWNGNPTKAYIDLTAAYRLNASLYELTLDSLDKQRVPIACNLRMTNQLSNPKIDFSIDVKSQNSTATSVLSAMSQDEINKQLITLLVLNRFYTPENMLAGGQHADVGQPGAIGVTGSEMLSNQLSNWLSQMSDKLDINVRYRPGSNISKDEVEVALSTQLFNDKVTINSNVNMGGNRYTTTQTSNTNAIAGDVSIEYKLNPSGTLRTKVFNKSNDNVLLYQNAPYSQGIGIFYTESFNSWKDLKQKYLKFAKKQKERIVKKWKEEPW